MFARVTFNSLAISQPSLKSLKNCNVVHLLLRLTFFILSTFIPTRFLIFQCCLFLPGLPLSAFTSEDRLAALCKRLSALCFIFFALERRTLGRRHNPFSEGNEDLKLWFNSFSLWRSVSSFEASLVAYEADSRLCNAALTLRLRVCVLLPLLSVT